MSLSSSHNNNNDPQAGQGRPLPKKEGDLFKSVVKFYESKNYKKGIKASENILKKYPNHGETLCMKGLTLNCMNKREEAHEFVRKGLMKDMRSHVCWHVFGLLHRSDRNYNEAIKAYKQALKIDPENLQILRDLSLLQIQMRDVSGFVLTRHTILNLKPNNKIHWLAFALAKHLNNDHLGSINVIDIYLGTLNKQNAPELQRGFESSELALFQNDVMMMIPNNEEKALQHLMGCENLIVDETSWYMQKSKLHLKLKQFQEAENALLTLFMNGHTEHYKLHSAYMCALLKMHNNNNNDNTNNTTIVDLAWNVKGVDTLATLSNLTDDQKDILLQAYQQKLKKLYPRSNAIQRIPLTLLQGDDLKTALDRYCRHDLTKGVPYLATDLKSLLTTTTTNNNNNSIIIKVTDPVDVKQHATYNMIVNLVDSYIVSLINTKAFPNSTTEESPSTLLWTWYLRACLYEYTAEYKEALQLLDRCLLHTPTAVDVYEKKAQILKHSGDISLAATVIDQGRMLDLQDRYINNKTTEYLLQSDQEIEARKRISLFTRHEGNPEQNLFDMQCTWYELELAACLFRKRQYGKSLKKYIAVEKHFEDFHEDQFDFHSYCIRKVTLRAYVNVLKWEDELWSQACYIKAAKGIITNYLHLFDHPKDAYNSDTREPDYTNMTPAQKKKAKAVYRKKKKQAEKRQQQEEEKIQQQQQEESSTNTNTNTTSDAKKKEVVLDDDPNGEQLLKKNPLEEAKRYISTLVKNAPNQIITWILSYDVAIRRGKKLMALQALFKAKAIDPTHTELFQRTVDFALFHANTTTTTTTTTNSDELQNNNTTTNTTIQKLLSSETNTLLGASSSSTVNDFVQTAYTNITSSPYNKVDLQQRIQVAIALVKVNNNNNNIQSKDVAATLIVDHGLEGRNVSVETCKEALSTLTKLDAKQAKELWLTKLKDKYPLAAKDLFLNE